MLLQGHYIASFPGPPENEANQLQATKILASFPGSPGTRIYISTPAQLQFSRSQAWEPGNEATKISSYCHQFSNSLKINHQNL